MHPSSHYEYGKYDGAQGYPSAMTNIPAPQPAPPFGLHLGGPNSAAGRQWSTNLCHCFDDPANCLITCICPCVTFGQIAEIVDKGEKSCVASGITYGLLLGLTGLACLYSCFYRSRLRGEYDLEESPCVDCLIHLCCETCALCQEYRQLKNNGFDMGIGWEANMRRQGRGITVAPFQGAMTR